MKKAIICLSLIAVMLLGGCRQSEKVNYNVSKEADSFNVVRRVAVINTVSGKPLFEAIGRISIDTETKNKLVLIVEVGKDKYKKHIIGLNTATTMYVVEDINGSGVSKYTYTMNYNPKHFQVFNFKDID